MNEQAKPIDALAVLDTVDACLHQLKMDPDVKAMHIARFTEARAAIAELIKAAECAANFDGLHTKNIRAMPFADDAMKALRAALANVSGGAK